MTDKTYEQWGRQYPDGTIVWQTNEGWDPSWSTKEGRDAERATYSATLERVGIVPSGDELTFLYREQYVTFSEPTVIDDTAPVAPETPPV